MTDIRRVFPATIELATLGTVIGAAARHPARRVRGGPARQPARPAGPGHRPDRLLGADLLARPDRAPDLLRPAGLGRRVPGASKSSTNSSFTPITGVSCSTPRCRATGASCAMSSPHHPARRAARLLLPRLYQPHDPLVHAERAWPGIHVAARAKGLSEARVIWRHALRNVAVPLITVVALSYAGLLEGSVLTETVFAWPGIGLYITDSLHNADMNAVLGGTIVDRLGVHRHQSCLPTCFTGCSTRGPGRDEPDLAGPPRMAAQRASPFARPGPSRPSLCGLAPLRGEQAGPGRARHRFPADCYRDLCRSALRPIRRLPAI